MTRASRSDQQDNTLADADTLDAEILARGAVLRRTDFQSSILKNKRNTVALCIALLIISFVLGYTIGWAVESYLNLNNTPDTVDLKFNSIWGIYGALIVTGIGVIVSLISISSGDRIVLSMSGARKADHSEERRLHNVVEEMAIAAGLPKPEVYVIESPALNAFATGLSPEKSAIAVTRGMLEACTRQELQGVVAHEMSHILNDDVLFATVIGVMVGWIAILSDGLSRVPRHVGRASISSKKSGGGIVILIILLVVIILAPISARLVQMSISRQREYLADATSVKLTRNPLGLIGALTKIGNTKERFKGANRGIQHIFITNPFRDFGMNASALMSTHPPLYDRIQRLQNLG